MQTTLVLIGEAITTTATTMRAIVTMIVRLTAMTTIPSAHSNIISDYVFQGIHTVKVLVLKRFIPS